MSSKFVGYNSKVTACGKQCHWAVNGKYYVNQYQYTQLLTCYSDVCTCWTGSRFPSSNRGSSAGPLHCESMNRPLGCTSPWSYGSSFRRRGRYGIPHRESMKYWGTLILILIEPYREIVGKKIKRKQSKKDFFGNWIEIRTFRTVWCLTDCEGKVVKRLSCWEFGMSQLSHCG